MQHRIYQTKVKDLDDLKRHLIGVWAAIQLQLQSFTLKQLFSEESCSVVGLSEEMSFQHRSELSATVER